MKKKTLTALAVCVLCVVCIVIGVCAATAVTQISAELRPDFTIVVDGQERTFKDVNGDIVDPILYEGTVYLPIRAIGELMGKTVYWYEDEKRIELKDENLKDESSIVTDADVIINGNANNATQPADNSGVSTTAGAQISEERALEIALERAGLTADQVLFEKTKLDTEHGILVYEVEFRQGNIEYSADINAADGTIISWEVDRK